MCNFALIGKPYGRGIDGKGTDSYDLIQKFFRDRHLEELQEEQSNQCVGNF